jgi:hypothetical protein
VGSGAFERQAVRLQRREEPMSDHQHPKHSGASPYLMLGLNLLISGAIMYLVMFTMIDGLPDFFNNLNMAYMAVMMVAPMAILMVVMMGPMYRNRAANLAIVGGFAALFALSLLFVRQQTAIGDVQFLRSMIPHHSGAVLMCQEAKLSDPQIRALCQQIVRSQRQEIAQMKAILARM